MHYVTNPPQVEVDGATIYVDVAAAENGWIVTMLLGRHPPTVPIEAVTVNVVALDANGVVMPVLGRPMGQLPEAGGSTSATANAAFHFAGSEPPSVIEVYWADTWTRFDIDSQ